MKHKYTLTLFLSTLSSVAIFGITHASTNNITYVKTETNEVAKEQPDLEANVSAGVAEETIEVIIDDNESSVSDGGVSPERVQAKEQALESTESKVYTVPFYSQFTDISAPEWRKIGCGIASLAMLIDFYKPGEITVDTLLDEGIEAGAYIDDAGWSHAGLIELGKSYGLSGEAVYMNELSMTAAFSQLQEELENGPVMASVHYTFKPTNPIPHLVIVTGVENGKVYYNDPAEEVGNGTVSIEQFQSAWKKRYIAIRP